MKQYCRYCSNCNWVDESADGKEQVCYCSISHNTFSGAKAKRLNKCKHFNLNPIDVFDLERTYQPRLPYSERKEKPKFTQLSLFGDEV